jgi:hypothetical protein
MFAKVAGQVTGEICYNSGYGTSEMNCNVYTIVETDEYRRDLPEMNCNVYTIVETDKVHLCSHVTHKTK